MRSSFTHLVIWVMSLLVGDALALPSRHNIRQRDRYVVQEGVVVTEEVTVTADPDGLLHTGTPVVVGTSTDIAAPSLVENSVAQDPSSSSPIQQASAAPSPAPTMQINADSHSTTTPTPSDTAASPAVAAPAIAATTPATIVQAASSLTIPSSLSLPALGASKRGLAYNDPSIVSTLSSANGKMAWAYNWASSPGNIPSNIEYVPMLWGVSPDKTNNWKDAASKAISNGSKHLLAFNEPDQAGQASVDVATAVAGYQQHMQPFAGQAKLGSVAVTNGGAPMGLTYLRNFIEQCTGCQIDFVAIHWYNGGGSLEFINHVTEAYNAGGQRPIWITEFAAPADDPHFLEIVLPWLDTNPMVERYSYFMAAKGNGFLLSGDGSLSSVGRMFVS